MFKRKSIISIFVVIVITATLMTTVASAQTWIDGCGIVDNCSYVNVREGPSTSDTILRVIPAGTTVIIESYPSASRPWYAISLNALDHSDSQVSNFGYIYKDYIRELSDPGWMP